MPTVLRSLLLPAIACIALAPARAQAPDPLAEGRRLVNAHQFPEAVAEFTKAIAADPQSPGALFERGDVLAELKKNAEAMKDFDEAIRLRPDYRAAWYMRGHLFARQGKHPNAIEQFSEAIRLQPERADAWHYRGLSYFEMNKREQAKSDFSKAIELNPKEAEAYYFRARILRREKNEPDLSDVCADLDRALALNPTQPKWRYERGQVLMSINRLDEAVADFTEAIRVDPATQLYFNDRASVYSRQGKYHLAVRDLTEAIRLKPEFPNFRQNRGINYYHLNELDKALADFDEAIRLNATHPAYFVWRAQVRAALEQKDEALRDLASAEALARQDPATTVTRGCIYARLGMNQEALKILEEYLQENTESAEALLAHGEVLASTGNLEGAIIDARAALEQDEGSPDACHNLARYYEKQGDVAAALRQYELALAARPDTAISYARLAFFNFRQQRADTLGALQETYVKLRTWDDPLCVYLTVLCSLAQRRSSGKEAGERVAAEALPHCEEAAWPAALLRYLAGRLPEPELLALATDTSKRTEAETYVALRQIADGRHPDARSHLEWVRDHGRKDFLEYDLALSELAR